MPPRRGESLERTDEYEDFIKNVAEFHEKRGYVIHVCGHVNAALAQRLTNSLQHEL